MKTQRIQQFNRLVFLILFQAAFIGYAQMNVVPFSGDSPSPENNGIIYSLPRSVVKIQMEVVRTENFKGPYAERLTRISFTSSKLTKSQSMPDL